MSKIICGIDIGSLGSCVLFMNNEYIQIKPKDYLDRFKLLKYSDNDIVVYIEKLHAFPGMSSGAVWSMAESQGNIKGILEALDIPYIFITAMEWQKDLILPKKQNYKTRKENLFAKAKEIFPNEPIKKYSADSWLICKYAIEQENKKTYNKEINNEPIIKTK